MYDLREIGSYEETDELYSLASRSSFSITSYTSCVINGVNGWPMHVIVDGRPKIVVAIAGTKENTFYGCLEAILEFSYIFRNRVLLFRCKGFDTDPKKKRLHTYKNITSIFINSEWYKDNPFIPDSQAKQVFYIADPLNGPN